MLLESFKEVMFLTTWISHVHNLTITIIIGTAVHAWNQQQQSMQFLICDLKQKQLWPYLIHSLLYVLEGACIFRSIKLDNMSYSSQMLKWDGPNLKGRSEVQVGYCNKVDVIYDQDYVCLFSYFLQSPHSHSLLIASPPPPRKRDMQNSIL